MNTINALIFDLDGTLINSLDDLADATNTVLAQADYPTHPVQAYKLFVGNGLRVLLERALVPTPNGRTDRKTGGIATPPPASHSPRFETLLKALQEEYDAHWADKSRPYPGIEALLGELSGRHTPIAVLSNKPHGWTQTIVQHFFPSIAFTGVRGAMPNVPHKPDPTAALDVARLLGFSPASIAFVGDSNVDIRTGRNAGMYPIGVTWGFRDETELREAGAASIIHTPEALLGFV